VEDKTEESVLDVIEKARKAQQRYLQTHDVQLEMELDSDDGTEGQADEDQEVESAPGQEQGGQAVEKEK
jgi:hypothetical protein